MPSFLQANWAARTGSAWEPAFNALDQSWLRLAAVLALAPSMGSGAIIRSAGEKLPPAGFKTQNGWVHMGQFAMPAPLAPPRAINLMADPGVDIPRLEMHVRYSADGQHWTTWKPLKREVAPKASFALNLSVPKKDVESFDSLYLKWLDTRPHRAGDFWEFSRWAQRAAPDYFKTHIPFIGFLDLRARAPGLLKRMGEVEINMGWGESGVTPFNPPPDPLQWDSRDRGKWTFPKLSDLRSTK